MSETPFAHMPVCICPGTNWGEAQAPPGTRRRMLLPPRASVGLCPRRIVLRCPLDKVSRVCFNPAPKRGGKPVTQNTEASAQRIVEIQNQLATGKYSPLLAAEQRT